MNWLSNILSQPGVMVGMGLGLCMGYFLKGFKTGPVAGDEHNPEDESDDGDGGWDEDAFLADGSGEYKLVLIVRNDLKMGKGKVAAQCSHATLKAFKQSQKSCPKILRQWEMNGQPKVVLKVDDEGSMLDLASLAREVGLTVSLIQDAGRTQIAPGSRTVLGLGPGPVELIDQISGHLKLY